MLEVLQEIINRERAYFGLLSERMQSFSARQNENQTMGQIYGAYYDSYQIGTAALYYFERAVEAYQAGNLAPLQEIAGPQFPAPQSTSGGLVLAIVAATRLPSDLCKKRLRWHVRQIAQGLLWLLTQTQESEALQQDIQTIGALLVTFEHPDPEEQESKGGAGWAGFGLGALAGFGAREGFRIIGQSIKERGLFGQKRKGT